jgi:hypothetical protein
MFVPMFEGRSLLASQKQNRANRGKKQTCALAVAKFAARASERSGKKKHISPEGSATFPAPRTSSYADYCFSFYTSTFK